MMDAVSDAAISLLLKNLLSSRRAAFITGASPKNPKVHPASRAAVAMKPRKNPKAPFAVHICETTVENDRPERCWEIMRSSAGVTIRDESAPVVAAMARLAV